MKNASTGQIWLARVTALVVLALGLSVMFVVAWHRNAPYTHTIRVTVNGDPNEVVAAVERLNRPDTTVRVQVASEYWDLTHPVRATGRMAVALTFSLGLFLVAYCAVYRAVWALLGKMIQRDDTLIGPV